MLLPLLWRPSHVLLWTPRSGAVRSWLVRIIATSAEGRPVIVAQTAEDDQVGRAPAWARCDDDPADGSWRWHGLAGYRGEPGTVTLNRLED
jgi:hypothetical protein